MFILKCFWGGVSNVYFEYMIFVEINKIGIYYIKNGSVVLMSYLEFFDEENLIVSVFTEIDESFLSEVKTEYLKIFCRDHIKRIVLNCSSLNKISSEGFSVLFNLKVFFMEFNIEVLVINVSAKIASLFQEIGLDQIICQEIKFDFASVLKSKDTFEKIILSLNSSLNTHKELYKKVTSSLEEKLEKCNAELRIKDEQLIMYSKTNSLGELTAGIAHEFNNIIGGIMGYAQLAQQKKNEEIIDKALKNIIIMSKRAEGITSGLLKFSRQNPIEATKVNFKEIIQSVLNFSQKQFEVLGIKIHTDLQNVNDFSYKCIACHGKWRRFIFIVI